MLQLTLHVVHWLSHFFSAHLYPWFGCENKLWSEFSGLIQIHSLGIQIGGPGHILHIPEEQPPNNETEAAAQEQTAVTGIIAMTWARGNIEINIFILRTF